MRRLIFITVGCSLVLFTNAQEYLGIRNSNYAGIQSVFLNPSSITGTKLSWDFNIISGGTFFDNDFFFVPKGNVPPLGFRKTIRGAINEDLFFTHFDPNNPNKLYRIAFSNVLIGPSFFKSLNRKEQIGFTFAVRGYANVQDVPGHLAQNAFDNLENKGLWGQPWHDSSSRMNAAEWVEYGLHYSRLLSQHGKHQWRGGVSLKFLQGVAATYLENTHLNYTVVDSSKVILTNSSLDYGSTKSYPNLWPSGAVHGFGLSGDIGVTYVYTNDPTTCPPDKDKEWSAQPDDRYTVKIGASLLDLGYINFSHDATAGRLVADSAVYENLEPPSHGQPNRPLTDLFNQNDSLKHTLANRFTMRLPTALSLQADWNVYRQFYLNATLIKGLGHGNNLGVFRPDIYSLTPRYETEWFEVSVPISMLYYHYWIPRVGVAFRFGYFFFGADAFGGLFGLRDFERTDVYAGIRIFHLSPLHKGSSHTKCPDPVK